MKYLLSLLCFCVFAVHAVTTSSYYRVTSNLYEAESVESVTFYTGCYYDPLDRAVYPGSCGYRSPTQKTPMDPLPYMALRVEVDHVMPASRIGRDLACWDKPIGLCEGMSSRACCLSIDPKFKGAMKDAINLVVSVGEINRAKSDRGFSDSPQVKHYGDTDVSIGTHFNPPTRLRGDIARIWLYMSRTYDIKLTEEEHDLFLRWAILDPVSFEERLRATRNGWVSGTKNKEILPLE